MHKAASWQDQEQRNAIIAAPGQNKVTVIHCHRFEGVNAEKARVQVIDNMIDRAEDAINTNPQHRKGRTEG